MIKIRLHGKLKEIYQETIEANVRTIAEVMSCLRANFSGFNENFVAISKEYHVVINDTECSEQDLLNPIGKGATVELVPVIAGSKSKWATIILAAALIWVGGWAVLAANAAVGATATGLAATVTGAIGATATGVIGMTLAGVGFAMLASVFTPKPKAESNDSVDNQPSNSFNGPTNTISQGSPIPVGYGELMVGSAVIYAALTPEEVPI